MPELPDITVYIEALEARLVRQPLVEVTLKSPFLVRTFDPPLKDAKGREVTGIERIGKRIVLVLEGDLYLVFHLMIAGRFRWRDPGSRTGGRNVLAVFEFPTGLLVMTEASSKKRASLHVVQGRDALATLDPGGLEPLTADLESFHARLSAVNHTLKRALSDPRIISGVGNAYSDEILHRARLSPVKLTSRLKDVEIERLYHATQAVLEEWTERFRERYGSDFPEKVTAFHAEMAVHGRHGKPCPVCDTNVQRIVRAQNETNYCPTCQTDGKLLRDRALSRLLKADWPRTVEEWEEHRRGL